MLLWCAEAHHLLHAGPVVPRPIEHGDFSGRWQMRNVALEVPLGHFGIVGFRQRDMVTTARIQMLAEALDRSTLARRITTFKQDHHALSNSLDVTLRLEQFDLEQFQILLIVFRADRFVVGKIVLHLLDHLDGRWTLLLAHGSCDRTAAPDRRCIPHPSHGEGAQTPSMATPVVLRPRLKQRVTVRTTEAGGELAFHRA